MSLALIRATSYMPPQQLVDVDHRMRVMTEESFGPVVGIIPVRSDDEAVGIMNDGAFGLTASVWTRDSDVAEAARCPSWAAARSRGPSRFI